jgi:hypothetical protein
VAISIVPEDDRIRRFEATGGETLFPVTYPFFAAGDLLVLRLRAGVTDTLALGIDYSVSGAGNPAGGAVTLAAPAEAGDVVVIVSAQPYARASEWQDGAALTARTLNAEFARWWIAAQQLRRDGRRAIRTPITDPLTSIELPPASERAGRILGFDPVTGDPVAVTPNPGNLVISAQGEALIAAATPAAARGVIAAAASADLAALDAATVKRAGDTMTGNLTIDKNDPEMRLRSAAPSTRVVRFQTGNQDRFLFGVSATPESGSNTGSNAFLRRVLDDGTQLGVITVERNTGRVNIEGTVPLRLPGVDPQHENDAVRRAYVDARAWSESGSLTATGAAVGVTSLPSGIREIIINFHLVSTTGTQPLVVQLGTSSSGYVSSGYNSSSMRAGGTTVSCAGSSSGFLLNANSAAATMSGFVHLTRFSPQSPNVWQAVGMVTFDTVGALITTTGYVSMPTSPADRVRVACFGSDTFDSGVFNVMWRV